MVYRMSLSTFVRESEPVMTPSCMQLLAGGMVLGLISYMFGYRASPLAFAPPPTRDFCISGKGVIMNHGQLAALHVVTLIPSGIYIHEFITHLDFDWELITRRFEVRRAFVARTAKWIYLACRVLVLGYTIGAIIALSFPEALVSGRLICRIPVKLAAVTGPLGVMCSSMLLSIRVGAIWGWKRPIVILLAILLLALFALDIDDMVKIDPMYQEVTHSCSLNTIQENMVPSTVGLVVDITLISFLLVGLQGQWGDARRYALWHMLWNQGVFYLVLSLSIRLPLVILQGLDISPALTTLLVVPDVVALSMGATRLFRSLNAIIRGTKGNAGHFSEGLFTGDSDQPQESVELETMLVHES
ncbi:unnamed protein product [Peniophora sp. CBMAI 1063]|nr:unnamed protein product [Peniophora sp. CBMAI 1063]